MTQVDLAKRSGLAADTLRRLETGSFSPSLQTLRKLCEGLDISLATLFDSFDTGRNLSHELVDLVAGRSTSEVKMVTRVLRALFDELDGLGEAHDVD